MTGDGGSSMIEADYGFIEGDFGWIEGWEGLF